MLARAFDVKGEDCTMKRQTMAAVMITMATLAGAALAQEEEAGVAAGIEVPVLSAYVWRGQVLNDEAVLQPSFEVSKGGFALNTWANYNLTDNVTDNAGDCNEVDLTASYELSAGPATFNAGVVEYLFPNTDASSTREASIEASLDNLPVTPGATVVYDFDEADGFYVALSLSYGHEISESLMLNLEGSIGYGFSNYNEFYFGVADDALNDGTLSAGLDYAVNDSWTITPAVTFTALLDGDIRDAANELYFDDHQVVGSLTASCAF
jgi:hypothetical protein